MVQKTKNYTFQYKNLFYLSWIFLYFIFPAWISLHSNVKAKGLEHISESLARSIAISILTIYFLISAYLVNFIFKKIIVDNPVVVRANDWFEKIKNNLPLLIICFISAILHIRDFYLVEVGYLKQGLWIYDFSTKHWERLFDFQIQYGLWSVVLLILIIQKTKTLNSISKYITATFSVFKSSKLLKIILVLSVFGLFHEYSQLFPYSLEDSLMLLREPPVSHYLYLITYYSFGVSQFGPRIVQLIFYMLGAVYLYRVIYLFRKKEIAILGATIYLFSPLIFHYASMTFLATGAVFFMILISFYFLRFIKEENNRDLILTSWFIGIGFMYRREILVMLIICFAYLLLSRIKKRNGHSLLHFQILLLSLISIVPFYMIGRSGVNYYSPIFSNLISIDNLFMVLQSQMSIPLSFLLLLSIAFVFFKRDDLSFFYAIHFIAFYLFFTLSMAPALHRYSMSLYPAIAVLMSQFISSIISRFDYKHIFKLTFSIISIYLIFLCLVPRSSTNLITFKYKDFESQQYPIEEAAEWIRNNTTINEKILFLSIPPYYKFYIERIYPNRDKINHERFIYYFYTMVNDLVFPLKNLREFCSAEHISYIMFPFGPKNDVPDIGASKEVKYLKESSDNEFTELARFNNEDNYILIYKLTAVQNNRFSINHPL